MIKFSFSAEALRQHLTDYFTPSLQYFPQHYLRLILEEGSVIPDHAAYVCPLCVTNTIVITREQIRATSDFDKDHYPPESVGGRNTILLCKTCNQQAGHNYEYDLKNHLTLASARSPDSLKIDIKSQIKDVGKFSGKIFKEADQWIIDMKPNQSKVVRPLDNWLEYSKTNHDWEMNLIIPKPKDENVNKSLLKAAYLYCFSLWGYEFAFSKTGDLIRDVLNDKATYPMMVTPLQLDKHETVGYNTIPIGVSYISKPLHLRSLLVNIKIKSADSGYETVHPIFIPNPTETGFEDMKQIQKWMDAKSTGEINIGPLKSILKETPLAYSKTWEEVKNLP